MKPIVHKSLTFSQACFEVLNLASLYGKLTVEYNKDTVFVRYSDGKYRLLDIFPILASEKP